MRRLPPQCARVERLFVEHLFDERVFDEQVFGCEAQWLRDAMKPPIRGISLYVTADITLSVAECGNSMSLTVR